MGKIILIVAMDSGGGIGNGDDFPWRKIIPADMSRVRKITLRKTLLIGRKTYEIIWNKFGPLKDREEIIVLTRDTNFKGDGVTVLHTKDAIIELAKTRDIYVFGGAEIYNTFQPHSSLAYVTEVEGKFEADAHFFWHDEDAWKLISPPIFVPPGIATNSLSLVFKTLKRRTPLA